jgi:hypothetical protein
MKSFLARFGALVSFVLSGFDRLRFCGESRLLNHARGVQSYLYQRRIPFKDYPEHAEELTKTLRRQTEQRARADGVPLLHLDSPDTDKEAVALRLAQQHQRTTGRLALLTCVESCLTYRLRKDADGRVAPRKEKAKCLHYYHYFHHPEFGRCYVRLQSWFPFSVRVGLNGRQWLYRQLEQRGVPFTCRDNLLLSVAEPELAQQLLAQQTDTDWPTALAALVEPLQPLWAYLHEQARTPYYWMTEQSEWATDFVFHDPTALARWYPRWLRYGVETLQCKDVLRYLGKQVPARGYGRCTGEVKIDLRARAEGTRLKFWYGTNSLKIYDKAKQAFRIETTINQPQGFQVYRTKEGAPADAPKSWQQMRKGVADLGRRAEVSQAANNRLAESLATVAQPDTLGELLKPLGQPVLHAGRRRARALNPLTGADGTLLRALAHGDFLIKGFRNADVRAVLEGAAADAAERRRQSARMTRQLALLRAHGLIIKVQKSHRYHLSAAGRRVVTALAAAHASDVTRLAAGAEDFQRATRGNP